MLKEPPRGKVYTSTGMHIGAILTAFAELVTAIVASAYCCQGVCGTSNKNPPLVVSICIHTESLCTDCC